MDIKEWDERIFGYTHRPSLNSRLQELLDRVRRGVEQAQRIATLIAKLIEELEERIELLQSFLAFKMEGSA